MSKHSIKDELLERFLRYVSIDTQSKEDVDCYPSTEKQKDLSKLLVEELKALGVNDAEMDQYGYVFATIESNVDQAVPVIGLIAHVDTAPDMSGKDIKPQIHENYQGGPIELGHGYTLTPEQSPALNDAIGQTVITTDGSTLLGADDKAGVAEIMTLVQLLRDEPSIKHGKIRIAFTVDEEVGQGTKYFDVKKFGADYAYTLDGESPGEIENETFCADSASVTFYGINVHPGYAKDKMINALKAASAFVAALPQEQSPECTSGREGYMHPTSITGGVEEAKVKLILRDFEEEPLKAFQQKIKEIIVDVEKRFKGIRSEVEFSESYRNMRFVLDKHPHVTKLALAAVERAGLKPRLELIRGGTDGAQLSYQGLPTPNIFAGGHLFHSRFEWVAVEGMIAAVDTLSHLVELWVEHSSK